MGRSGSLLMERMLWALVVLLLIAVVAVWWWQPVSTEQAGHQDLPLRHAPQGGDFVLNRDGQEFALRDYRGQVVLLYFGYTYCPDVCPTSLAIMRHALRQLTPEQQERVQGVFVSVDPERDTPAQLAEYTAFFHPNIRGVSGQPEQLATAGDLYGAAWQRVDSDSAMGYAVDHSSNTYVIDPGGRLIEILPHGSSAQSILDVVLPLISIDEE